MSKQKYCASCRHAPCECSSTDTPPLFPSTIDVPMPDFSTPDSAPDTSSPGFDGFGGGDGGGGGAGGDI